MLFVKTEKLKVGMRLARPIYNKNGVLLFERDSKLTSQGIASVQNFQLIGIFILEAAEPVPPMGPDDIAFERFQTMEVFAIQEELNCIIKEKKILKISSIASDIIRNYGRNGKRVNFTQNLRSKEDFVYKHSLNVAILCALMSHSMGMKLEEQLDTVICALVHDIGKVPKEEIPSVMALFEQAFPYSSAVKAIWIQYKTAMVEYVKRRGRLSNLDKPAKILFVADFYDKMTGMKFDEEPASEVKAIRTLLNNPENFDADAVEALIRTITILSPGTCIELTTREKGLVLESNIKDVLRPVVLCFDDNKVIDLKSNENYEIKDIMKTLDNRYVFDIELLKEYGYVTERTE